MLGKKFEDFDVFTGCDRHRLSGTKIEPEIEGSVRLHWPLITPKRLLTDFEKITIRKEAKPIIAKMNAFRHLEADQSSHLSFLVIERVREALVVKLCAPPFTQLAVRQRLAALEAIRCSQDRKSLARSQGPGQSPPTARMTSFRSMQARTQTL